MIFLIFFSTSVFQREFGALPSHKNYWGGNGSLTHNKEEISVLSLKEGKFLSFGVRGAK